MNAFCAVLRPSRHWLAAAAVFHAAAAVMVCVYGSGAWRAVWLAAFAASAVWTVRAVRRLSIAAVAVDRKGRARLHLPDGSETDAQLLPHSRVLRHSAWLCFQTPQRRVAQFVWRDMTDAESFRRLKVWAVWCSPCEQSDDTDSV